MNLFLKKRIDEVARTGIADNAQIVDLQGKTKISKAILYRKNILPKEMMIIQKRWMSLKNQLENHG